MTQPNSVTRAGNLIPNLLYREGHTCLDSKNLEVSHHNRFSSVLAFSGEDRGGLSVARALLGGGCNGGSADDNLCEVVLRHDQCGSFLLAK